METLLNHLKNRKLFFLLLLFIHTYFSHLNAQPFENYQRKPNLVEESGKSVTVIAEPKQIKPNEYQVDFKVKDFNSINACEFSLKWNVSKFHSSRVQSLNEKLTFDKDIVKISDSGSLEFVWNTSDALTLEDEESIFKLRLWGQAGLQDTLVAISGDPVAIFCRNERGEHLEVLLEYRRMNTISRVPFHVGYEIAPNPGEGIFYIQSLMPGEKIDVLNAFGQMVKADLRSEDGTIDISYLSSGTYFLRIKTVDFHIVEKVVILK